MKILAIETSCDETAAAVVEDGRRALSNVVATQIPEHRLYGGVVPEIASRRHCESIVGVADKALRAAGLSPGEPDALAVTYAPGLIGALLVGVNFAKGLALATGKPLIPVHHLRGHIAANYLADPKLAPPFLCLVVSGGHTHFVEAKSYTDFFVLARTRDDAVGEAYDKAARAMGYSYPGGVELDRAAQSFAARGAASPYRLPRPQVEGSELDMSFSGLKTAVLNLLNRAAQTGETIDREALAFAFQQSVCDILADRAIRAMQHAGATRLVLAGGVSANSGLRARMRAECEARGWQLFMPPLCYCGDNAAMIGSQAFYEFRTGTVADLGLNAKASLEI